MLKEIRDTTKHSVIYAFGNAATKIIGIILIPIYTDAQFLSQADFGALAILEAMAQILTGIFTLAMVGSLQRWYWDKDYEKSQKRVFFTSYAFLLGMNIPIFSLLIISAGSLSTLIFGSLDFSYLVKLTVITVGIRIANQQTLTLYRLQSRSTGYTIIQVLKLSVVLFLTIWFVTQKRTGLVGIWEAALYGELLIFVVLLPAVVKNIELKFDLKILKEMFAYGYPLMLSSVAVTVLTVTDRFMLKFLSGLEETAVYSLGLRIANTLNLVVTTSINSALAPVRMKKMGEADNQRFYAKIFLYVAVILTFAMLGLSLFSLEILKLLTDQVYWTANFIIPILAFSFLFSGIRYSVNIGLMIEKKTKIMGLLILLASVINLLLNFLLIPKLDIYGVSLSTFLSQFFLFAAVVFYAQKAYPIPYEWKKMLLLIISAVVFIGGGLLLGDVNAWVRVPLKIIILCIYPLSLVWMGFFDREELDTLKRIFRTWRNPGKIRENMRRLMGV